MILPWSILLMGIALPPVELERVDGQTIRGQIQELSLEQVVLAVDGKLVTVPATDVRWLRGSAASTIKPAQVAWLQDGTQLVWSDFQMDREQATLVGLGGQTFRVVTGQLQLVQFQDLSGNESLMQQWVEIVRASPEKDRLIYKVQRDGTTALDVLEGLVHRVGKDSVAFDYEGQRIEPKRERIVGILFFRPGNRRASEPSTKLQLKDGSVWSVRELRLEHEQLAWVSMADIRATAMWDDVVAIDFAAGHSLYLSDLPVETSSWRTFVPSVLPEELLAPLRSPRFNQAFDGGPLQLAGRAWHKGIALHSYNEVTYRLPEGYRYLRAWIGLDDRLSTQAGTGDVVCRLLLDGKVVWERSFQYQSEPIPIELPLGAARRLTIIADYGQAGDAGDYLCVVDARLTK